MDKRPNLLGLFVSDKGKNTALQHLGQLSFKQILLIKSCSNLVKKTYRFVALSGLLVSEE